MTENKRWPFPNRLCPLIYVVRPQLHYIENYHGLTFENLIFKHLQTKFSQKYPRQINPKRNNLISDGRWDPILTEIL